MPPTIVQDYQQQLIQTILDLSKQQNWWSSPLNLGGGEGPDGGSGIPIGDIFGQLIQSKVAFDTTEAAVLGIPISGASLVTNLDRIRYRIESLEASGIVASGIILQHDDVFVDSGVTILNFEGSGVEDVATDGPSKVTVTISGGGGGIGPHTLGGGEHTDVTLTGEIDGDFLIYDATITGWRNDYFAHNLGIGDAAAFPQPEAKFLDIDGTLTGSGITNYGAIISPSLGQNEAVIVGLLTRADVDAGVNATTTIAVLVADPIAGGTVDDAYGVYVAGVTAGTSNNWAIYTFEGLISLGDDLQFRQNAEITTTAGNLTLTPDGVIILNADTTISGRFYLEGPLTIGSVKGEVLTFDGNEWVPSGVTGFADTDELVKVSSNDTTAGYLDNKLIEGTYIVLTEVGDGGDEDLRISASGLAPSGHLHDDRYYLESEVDALLHSPVTVLDTASLNLELTGQALSGYVIESGVDHGLLAGLGDDDHPQYSPSGHLHDDRYYVESEVDALLALQDELSEMTDTSVGGVIQGEALVYDGSEWVPSGVQGIDTDELAKVSSNDTTAGYLSEKLIEGTYIVLTEVNDGGDEDLRITASGLAPSGHLHDDRYYLESEVDGLLHSAVTVVDTASLNLELTGQALSGYVIEAGLDHGLLAGLGDDDHPQYAASGHLHDSRYYLESEVDALLALQDELSELDDTSVGGVSQGEVLTYDGANWVPSGVLDTDTDELAKVSSNDTTSGYLEDKIVEGTNITIAVLNEGANEQLEITSTASGGGGGLWTDETTYLRTTDDREVIVGDQSVAPDGTLHVHTSSAGAVSADGTATNLIVEASANVGLSLLTAANSTATIAFGSSTSDIRGSIMYQHSSDSMNFRVADNERLSMDGIHTVINDPGLDRDFRVEADTAAYMFFLDAGNNNILIDASNTLTTADGTLHVHTSSAGDATANATSDDLVLESSGHTGMTIFSGINSGGYISFGDADSDAKAYMLYDHQNDWFYFNVAGYLALTMAPAGAVFNENSANMDFRVESNASQYMFFIDAMNNEIIIDKSNTLTTADGTLHIHTASAGSVTASTDANDLVLESAGHTGITVLSALDNQGRLYFGDSSDIDGGRIIYYHDSQRFGIFAGGSKKIDIETGEVHVNSILADVDFRVSSDTSANMFLVDSGNNEVLIDASNSVSTADGTLHVHTASAGTITAHGAANTLILENSSNGGMSILTPSGSTGTIYFGTDDDNNYSRIYSSQVASDRMTVETLGDFHVIAKHGGAIRLNSDNFDTDTIIKGVADSNLIYVDAGNNRVGIGTDTPDGKLHIQTSAAGAVTADSNYDDLVVENDGTTGISILANDFGSATLMFGHESSNTFGRVYTNYNNNTMYMISEEGDLRFETATGKSFLFNVDTKNADFVIYPDVGTANPIFFVDADADSGLGRVGIRTNTPASLLHVDQKGTSTAIPVLALDQADVSEQFVNFIGTAASGVLTQSLVDDGDVTTSTVAGWIKILVTDDGDQITDGDYYIPFYTLT